MLNIIMFILLTCNLLLSVPEILVVSISILSADHTVEQGFPT